VAADDQHVYWTYYDCCIGEATGTAFVTAR